MVETGERRGRCAGGGEARWRRGLSTGGGAAHRGSRRECHERRPAQHCNDSHDGDSAQQQRSAEGHGCSEGRLVLQRPEQRQHIDHTLTHVRGAREGADVHDGQAEQQQHGRTERKRHRGDEQERLEDGVRAAGRGDLVELHPRGRERHAPGAAPLPEQHRHQSQQRCDLRQRRYQLQPRNRDQRAVGIERSNQDLVDKIKTSHGAVRVKLDAGGCVYLDRAKFDAGRHICMHS